MLQSIRDKATGPLAWAIVAIISVPFAFFGIEAFRSGGGADYAAKVNGEEISRYELDQRVDARYSQFQQMLGDSFNPEMFNRSQLRGSVLEDLVRETVLRQYLSSEGRRISNARVLDFVASQEGFQDENGKFSPDLYRETLSRQGSSTERYEQRVRDFLGTSQFQNSVQDSGFVAEAELAAEWAWQEQERKLRWRRYSLKHFEGAIEVSTQDIEKLYAERQESLLTPERVQIEYIELSLDALASKIAIEQSAVQAVYDGEPDRFRVAEARSARHILVDDKATAEDLRAQISAGADFAELAKVHSGDPGSKNRGGDLGVVARGVMVPPFEEAVFSLSANELSAPVETQFGWHLIEVTKIEGGQVKPFSEVEEQIANSLRKKQARKDLIALQEKMEQAVFENPTSLAPAASELGVETVTSGWFTRDGGAGITADTAVVNAAFSDAVINGGENSPLLNVGEGVVVLRVAGHEEPRQKTLDEVREQLNAELTRTKAREAMVAAVESDEARLKDGEEWASLGDEGGVSTGEVTLKRNSSAADRGIVQAGFAQAKVQDYGRANLSAGDIGLVQVVAITDAAWVEADASQRKALADRVKARQASVEMQALISALRAQAEVVYAAVDESEGG